MKNFDDYNKKNNDDIPLTDLDYEGVIYEHSNLKDKPKNKKSSQNIIKPKKIKKSQDFNFSNFLIATISLGVIIFGIIFFLTYLSISDYIGFSFGNDNKTQSQNNIINNETPIIEELNEKTNKVIKGIFKELNLENYTVTLLDSFLNKNYILKFTGETHLQDKFENNISIKEFSVGDIVDFTFDSTNRLSFMKKSQDAFFEENISNFDIDFSNSTLKYNGNIYQINQNVLVYKDMVQFPIEKISKLDTLDIKGFNNQIFYIEIKKGNGVIKFINKPNIQDATLELDRDIFKPLSEVNSINIKEGKHKIVIRSKITTPYVKEVEVFSGKETIIDLKDVQNKKANILIKANISEYNLYINDKMYSLSEAINLPYGTYNIKIEKEGYIPFTTSVIVNKPQVLIQANLEKIEKLGKLNISSEPTEAQVFVDNAFIGYTPIEYKLPYGTHNILLKKDGYLDFNLSSITIGENDSVFNITMHKKQQEQSTQNTTENITETTTEKSS